jgi:hypothetical protein
VRYIDEAVLSCNGLGPLLYLGAFDFDCGSAITTDQVVVMGVAALPIHRLAIVADDDIHLTEISESLQGSIYGGETYLLTLLAQEIMQLLSGAKVVDL